jgi:hypothetical protein
MPTLQGENNLEKKIVNIARGHSQFFYRDKVKHAYLARG